MIFRVALTTLYNDHRKIRFNISEYEKSLLLQSEKLINNKHRVENLNSIATIHSSNWHRYH